MSALCLVLAGCVIALLAAEGFVRIFYPHSRDHVIPGGLFEFDNRLGWRLRAGKSAIHHSRYFDVTYDINALGFRDKIRNPAKDENIHRILFFGDSQIFGWGVRQTERFTDLVERQRRALEIWNLAVPGYGLDQQILSYEKSGPGMNASEVFFFISEATLERTRYNRIYKKYKPKFEMKPSGNLRLTAVPGNTLLLEELLYRTLSRLYLPYFLERRISIMQRARQQSDSAPGREQHVQKSLFGELEKRMLGRAINTSLVLGHRITIVSSLDGASRDDLQRFCVETGIGFLAIVFDPESVFTIGEQDSHWNDNAHERIARRLLSFLEQRDSAIKASSEKTN